MLNQADNPVHWVLLLYQLEDARFHLSSLIDRMARDGAIDEVDYAIDLGHVFAHLNRCWNARDLADDIPDGEWERYSRFPEDLDPVG